jgi:hypothetical protein
MASQFNKIYYLFIILVIATFIFLMIYHSELKINIKDNFAYQKINNNINRIKLYFNKDDGKNASILKQNNKIESTNITVPNMQPKFRKYAILSVSLIPSSDFYFFHLPMLVKAWERIGYKTIVLVVASKFPPQDKLGAKTIEYLEKFNAKVINLETVNNYEVIISLVSRLFSSLIDDSIINDDDFVITSDTDLYPIDSNYYLDDEKLSKNESIFLWNAFCCGNFNFKNRSYRMYPMGHIGMRKKYWRSVMNFNQKKKAELNSKFMLDYLSDFFKGDRKIKENDKIGRGDDNWYMDQVMIGVNIGNYKLDINKNINLVEKHHSCRRLDRGNNFVPGNYDMKQFCDHHSFHENVYTKLAELTKIYQNLFDKKSNDLIQQYIKEFMEIKNNTTQN